MGYTPSIPSGNDYKKFATTSLSAGAGGATPLGPYGIAAGAAQGQNGWIDKNNPWVQGPRQQAQAKKESEQAANDLYSRTGLLNQKFNQADQSYFNSFDDASSNYLARTGANVDTFNRKIDNLSNQAQTQANDAKSTYTNSILPEYKNAMGMAKTNAGQAMTLAQAGDTNNPIMKSVRDLYNQQGQQARQQGQQDFGVLSALGAQAAGQQFGAAGNPMTAGQQGQIYAANQGQAGNAYARAQQRMYDLQSQGIDRGFDQSNNLYQFGQQAQDRYSNTIKDTQNGENSFYDQQGRFRDEQGGYAGTQFNTNQGFNADRLNMGMMGADIQRGNAYGGLGREQTALNQQYGANQQAINNQAGANAANNASKGQFISSMIGAGAQAGAAYAGAPRTTNNYQQPQQQEQPSPYEGVDANRNYLNARRTA